jgi:hypothetical protein
MYIRTYIHIHYIHNILEFIQNGDSFEFSEIKISLDLVSLRDCQ